MAIIYTKGIKLYQYETIDIDGNGKSILHMLRIKKHDEKLNKYECIDLNTKETVRIDYDDAHNKWVRLIPDAIVSFNIVQDGPVRDVVIMTHPNKDDAISHIPFAVCRQDAIDIFRMATEPPGKGKVWAGISISQKTCPAEMSIIDFAQFDQFIRTDLIAAYNDDKIDDLLSIINVDKYDSILKTYYGKHIGDNLIGISETLKGLMLHTGFMYDFHEALDIVEVPFIIKDNDIDIARLLKDIIGQIEHAYVENVYIIPYSKEINVAEFERPYKLMIADSSKAKEEDQILYIVGYDIDPTRDYLTMKFGTNNSEDILRQLGFHSM